LRHDLKNFRCSTVHFRHGAEFLAASISSAAIRSLRSESAGADRPWYRVLILAPPFAQSWEAPPPQL